MTPLPKRVLDPPSYGTFSTPLYKNPRQSRPRSFFGGVQTFSGERVLVRKATLCNLRTIVHNCALLWPISKGNFRRKMTTIVWTSALNPHLDFPQFRDSEFLSRKIPGIFLGNSRREPRNSHSFLEFSDVGPREQRSAIANNLTSYRSLSGPLGPKCPGSVPESVRENGGVRGCPRKCPRASPGPIGPFGLQSVQSVLRVSAECQQGVPDTLGTPSGHFSGTPEPGAGRVSGTPRGTLLRTLR